MATLSEIRISSWRLLFIASRFPHLVISPNIYHDRQKLKEYQGIRETEAFEYENMRNNFKYCYYWEKWKVMSDCRDTRDPRRIFRHKIADEIVWTRQLVFLHVTFFYHQVRFQLHLLFHLVTIILIYQINIFRMSIY